MEFSSGEQACAIVTRVFKTLNDRMSLGTKLMDFVRRLQSTISSTKRQQETAARKASPNAAEKRCIGSNCCFDVPSPSESQIAVQPQAVFVLRGRGP